MAKAKGKNKRRIQHMERDPKWGPQGSVLGPLLFNLFINDSSIVVENCAVCNYADDNPLAVSVISIKKIISRLAADIMTLEN